MQPRLLGCRGEPGRAGCRRRHVSGAAVRGAGRDGTFGATAAVRPQDDGAHRREDPGTDQTDADEQRSGRPFRPGRPSRVHETAAGCGDPGQQPMPTRAAAGVSTVPGGGPGPRVATGTARTRGEVGAGSPAEHGLGEEDTQPAFEIAELFGGETAVAALGEMLLDIRQQSAAAPNRDVEETVVEAAILGRREFPVGAYTAFAEFFVCLLESGRRVVGIHAEQGRRHGYRLGLDLGVPQQTLGERRKSLERPLGELAILGRHGLRGTHGAAPGRILQVGNNTGYPLFRRPLPDRVAHGQQQPGPQRHTVFAERQPVEHPVEGGRRGHGWHGPLGGETDARVILDRPPVPRHEQRDGMSGLVLRTAPQPCGQGLVGFLGGPAVRRRVRRTRGCGMDTEWIPRIRFINGPMSPGHSPPRGCFTLAQPTRPNKALG